MILRKTCIAQDKPLVRDLKGELKLAIIDLSRPHECVS